MMTPSLRFSTRCRTLPAHERTLLATLGFADRDLGDERHDLACAYLCEPTPSAKLIEIVGWKPPARWRPVGDFRDRRTCGCRKLRLAESDPAGGWPDWSCGWSGEDTAYTGTATQHGPACTSFALEEIVQKGEGKYATTVGFLDVHLHYQATLEERGIWQRHPRQRRVAAQRRGETSTTTIETLPESCWFKYTEQDEAYFEIAIEVKIKPCSVGVLLRQINLYREYVEPGSHSYRTNPMFWVAALAWTPSVTEHTTLTDAGVHVVTLGADFERYCMEGARRQRATVAAL
jgi:hypothetical protein